MAKKITFFIIFLHCTGLLPVTAQYNRPSDDTKKKLSFQAYRPIQLIDMPTANILTEELGPDIDPKKFFHITLRVYNLGGMIGGISVGITRHLMFGVTYGGQNIIGEGDVAWNPAPGIHVRYKIWAETYPYPTIAFGFDSQGFGGYIAELNRYVTKSQGVYVVASSNFAKYVFNSGLHGGINYNTESKGGDRDLNIFLGAHLILEEELSLVWEYDFATNDNDETSLGAGKGYMNAGVRWMFAKSMILEFSAKNLLKNRKNLSGQVIPYVNRELKIIYRQAL